MVLARWAGSSEFGIFTYAAVWLNVVGSLCAAGFGASALRFLPAYRASGETAKAKGYLATGRWVCLLTGAAGASPWPDMHFRHARCKIKRCLCIAPHRGQPAGLCTHRFSGRHRPLTGADRIGSSAPIHSSAGACPGSNASADRQRLCGRRNRRRWRRWPWRHGSRSRFSFSGRHRSCGARFPPRPAQLAAKLWLSVSLPLLLVDGFALLLTNLDVLMLELWARPEDLGIYYAASKTVRSSLSCNLRFQPAHRRAFRLCMLRDDDPKLQLLKEAQIMSLVPSLICAAPRGFRKMDFALFGDAFVQGYPGK